MCVCVCSAGFLSTLPPTAGPVAFYAHRSSGAHTVAKGQTLLFDVVVTNVRGRYDATSGAFTAPTWGVYVFNVFFQNGSSNDADLAIVLNSQREVCKADARYSRDAASCSVVLELNAGDVVDVRGAHSEGATLEGEATDHGFSGYLIA